MALLICSNSKHKILPTWWANLGIVDEYKYLGIFLSKSGSFKVAKQHIAAQVVLGRFRITEGK